MGVGDAEGGESVPDAGGNVTAGLESAVLAVMNSSPSQSRRACAAAPRTSHVSDSSIAASHPGRVVGVGLGDRPNQLLRVGGGVEARPRLANAADDSEGEVGRRALEREDE